MFCIFWFNIFFYYFINLNKIFYCYICIFFIYVYIFWSSWIIIWLIIFYIKVVFIKCCDNVFYIVYFFFVVRRYMWFFLNVMNMNLFIIYDNKWKCWNCWRSKFFFFCDCFYYIIFIYYNLFIIKNIFISRIRVI